MRVSKEKLFDVAFHLDNGYDRYSVIDLALKQVGYTRDDIARIGIHLDTPNRRRSRWGEPKTKRKCIFNKITFDGPGIEYKEKFHIPIGNNGKFNIEQFKLYVTTAIERRNQNIEHLYKKNFDSIFKRSITKSISSKLGGYGQAEFSYTGDLNITLSFEKSRFDDATKFIDMLKEFIDSNLKVQA